MVLTDSGLSTPILLFLATLAFGFWLSRLGRPLNTLIFTVHKLVALTAVIFAGKTVYGWLSDAGIGAIFIALVIILGLCILALFISGAFLSREKPVVQILLLVHKLVVALAAVSAILVIYLQIG